MAVTVLNLATGERVEYVGITPDQAVVAAMAQELGDYNTWQYQDRYASQLVRNRRTVRCGDWTAMS